VCKDLFLDSNLLPLYLMFLRSGTKPGANSRNTWPGWRTSRTGRRRRLSRWVPTIEVEMRRAHPRARWSRSSSTVPPSPNVTESSPVEIVRVAGYPRSGCAIGGQHTELMAIGIGHDYPADLALADVDASRPEGDRP
jgi:hypothetical protein